MTQNGKSPVLVVVQLSGGNDFMNTVIPYTNPIYHDSRPKVGISQEQAIPLDDDLAFHPSLGPLKELYDQGDMAVVQGVGYPNSTRSHFRSMDIWHTCDTDKVGSEGWLGKSIRELDPRGENALTGVNIGRGLPRAMAAPGVPVSSVGDLDHYGVMANISDDEWRTQALEAFKSMYGQAIGTGAVLDHLAQTGADVLSGADMLKDVPSMYSSQVEYANNAIAKSLRDIARVHLAGLGTRVFYTTHGGYDTHGSQKHNHPTLLSDLSGAITDFVQDLKDHNASDEIVMLLFTEFGRRVKDNGTGTDHGADGGAFIIGDAVEGGLYSEYPSLEPDQLDEGDLRHTTDFRGLYATMLDQWLGVDSVPIVGGVYEQLPVFARG